jgi:hypothetical protein
MEHENVKQLRLQYALKGRRGRGIRSGRREEFLSGKREK